MTAVVEPPPQLSPHLPGETTPLLPSQPPALIFIPISLNHPPSGFEGEHLLLQELLLQQLPAVSSMQREAWTCTATRRPVPPLPAGRVTAAAGTGQHPTPWQVTPSCLCCADVTPIAVVFASVPWTLCSA